MQFDKLFNYNTEELIELMVKVMKDQKIGYPLGYSKNWRELIPEKSIPIVDGDEVEFDTKKGRKRGIAELVSNGNGQSIIQVLWSTIKYARTNSIKNIDEILKQAKTPINIFELNLWNAVDTEQYKQLIELLKWMYRNDTSEIVLDDEKDIQQNFVPISLDVDELEDLNIVDRNIVRVSKAGEGNKKVEPTKYPEPFVYSNKDRKENIRDISEYIGKILYPKLESLRVSGSNYNAYVIYYVNANPMDGIPPQGNDEIYSLPQILLSTYNDWDALQFKSNTFDSLPDSWTALVDNWKNVQRGGLFASYYRHFYSVDLPMTLAEFKSTEEKKLKPLGINNYQDVENLINTQKTKINTLALEAKQFDDPQVMDELVQEVIRRIEALNSEEIRLGSSISARVASFGNPNSDYLGNAMLSLFKNADQEQVEKVQKKVEEKMQEVVSPVEIAEEKVAEVENVSPTQRLIDELLELSEFETPREKKKTMRIIEDLRELMEFE
jgi:hypothetical protein